MSSLLSADLAAACNALGYFDPKTSKYYADANTLETVKDLIRYLRKDDENYDIRRQLGETKVLQTDLLPLLKNYWEESDLFDVLLRLIVNLTTPALVLWNEEAPVEKISRNHFLQIEDHLQGYKEAFADEAVWAVLSTRLSKLLELDYSERGDENSLIIERILILIRNVLYVPADVMEKRPDNDASIHDQVLWAIHQSGMLDIILYVTSSSVEHMYYFHILEILSFMMREQRPSDLASAALQRSQVEKVRDEAELLAIRHRETRDKQKKAKMFAGARHSRFGGTYVVKSMKSIGENELIYHKPLKKLDELTFDDDKRKLKTPKNRQPIIACTSERRSAFSIRLFLKEFCVEFLNGSYNTMMYHVKDNLVRARGRVQSNDCSYYFWAMRFFMEFNRHYKFEVKLISETMSVQTFHYVQQQSEQFYDLIASDKKRLKLWSKRLHVALLAYRELFLTLAAMDKSTEKSVQDSSKVIKNNIFYILEYREFILALLVNFDETKMSDQYLKDLIETQHIFLKMLENFCGKDGTFIVQQKARKAKNKTKKQIKPNQRVAEELNLDGKWDEVGPQLSCVLETVTEFPTDVVPFDAASDTPIDDQKAEAMRNIQRKLRRGDFEGAVVLLRAAREVWPENDSFGSDNMAPEEEFLALRDVFYADLGENEIARETDQQSADEDTENEEENDEPHSNEGTFKFEDFTKRLPNPKIVRACGIALRQFDNNTVHTNMCIVKLLHRIAFDCKMYVMIFQLSIFRTFQRIFSMKDAPQNKELTKFATYIIRQFIKVSETNKKVFMEALFWKTSQDCHQIETNYAEDLHKSTASERAWSEEQEDELRRLFMEHQQTNNGEDVVDWIVDNLINTNRTRRGVLKKLKEMCLLTAYKGRRKSGSTRPSATWTAVEESLLRKLYEEFKDFDDPLESVMQRLEVPRPKNRIIEKLLVMGLIQDRKEVRKKKSRSRSSRKSTGQSQSENESDISEADSIRSSSPGITSSNQNKRATKKKDTRTKALVGKNLKKRIPVVAVPRAQIIHLLLKVVDMSIEMEEALAWLRDSLSDAVEDYEEGNNEGIPLVPLMDYAESAMENDEFRRMLKAFGIREPFDEQEKYWRIPGELPLQILQSYCDLIQQAIDRTLTEEGHLEPANEIQNDKSSDEDVFQKLRAMTKPKSPTPIASKPAANQQKKSFVLETDSEGDNEVEDHEVNITEVREDRDISTNGEMEQKNNDSNHATSTRPSRNPLDSDDEEEEQTGDKTKRIRSPSDSDSGKRTMKRSRVLIESDSE